MDAKTEYAALTRDLTAIEKAKGGLYLVDEGVDMENVRDAGLSPRDEGFWPLMLSNLKANAGARAEDYGLNINELVGRVIY